MDFIEKNSTSFLESDRQLYPSQKQRKYTRWLLRWIELTVTSYALYELSCRWWEGISFIVPSCPLISTLHYFLITTTFYDKPNNCLDTVADTF